MKFKKLLSTVCASTMLFSSIFCCKAEPFPCRVCFVGGSGTGKTSISNRLNRKDFNKNENQTFCPEFFHLDSNDITLQIWDTGGQERLLGISLLYLRKSSVVCIFLDVSQNDYTERLNNWLRKVDEKVGQNYKKIIVLNKTDLPKVSVKVEEAKRAIMGAHNDIPENQIISCSAKTGDGVETLKGRMFGLTQSLHEYQQYEEQRQQEQRQQELRQQEQRQQELRQQEQQRQKRRKNLTIGSLVTAGIVAIGYGAREVYKRLTSNDKDKNVNVDKLKKNHKQTKATA